MARVTIEDCLENVENRFVLVHATAQRTQQLFKQSTPLVDCKNKEIVCALREIAENKILVTRIEEEEEEEKEPVKKTKKK